MVGVVGVVGGVGVARLRTSSRHLDIMMPMNNTRRMRTTLTLDDDVYRAARNIAAARKLAIGTALSELARKGLAARESPIDEGGLPVFQVAESAPRFGSTDVASAEDEQ